jgi:flagellar P-ring protein precursor FlgI
MKTTKGSERVRMNGRLGGRPLRRTSGVMTLLLTASALADVRVQDIARLQGQHTNKLIGYGLVVGLDGTGDGGKNQHTMRALMSIHRKFHQPVISPEELKNVDNVALAAVEAVIPEFGARQGQTLDVVVSAFSAKSLAGGQLLTTPLQYAVFDESDPVTQQIVALAGGRVDVPDSTNPQRGVIRGGATLEADFFYNFILDGDITLVLDDSHAGFQWAQLVARAINHELKNPAAEDFVARHPNSRRVVAADFAEAIGPKNVRVHIPAYELPHSARFISRVLQTPVFMTPQQPARVVINRTTGNVSFTGTVTISPTVLQIPGLGTVAIGGSDVDERSSSTTTGPNRSDVVAFQELLTTLNKLQLSREQMVGAVEHLHHTGTLHAQLVYTE